MRTNKPLLLVVRKVIPVEQGLRLLPLRRILPVFPGVRKVIPVEQGLRLYLFVKQYHLNISLERLFQ